MTIGAALYFGLPTEPTVMQTSGALSGALMLFSLAWLRLKNAFLVGISLAVLSVALGFGAAKFRTETTHAPVIVSETGPVLLEGWIKSIEPGQNGPRLRLRVHAIAGLSPEQTPEFVRVTHRSSLEVSSGRFVRCWSVLRPPPAPSLPSDYDFRRQAYFQKLGGVGYVQGRCRGGTLGAPDTAGGRFEAWLSAKRRALARYVNATAGERAGGFAAAVTSGDRSFMAFEDQEALRQSGLAHLLAISGLHLGIVGGLVYLMVFRGLALIEPLSTRMPVQKPAALAAILATFSYLVVSGASISTQRAFIMAAVFFGAILLNRAAISFRSFAVAMTLVVLFQPEGVVAPGFQMSFAATGALIAVYSNWDANRRYKTGAWSRFSSTVSSIVVTSLVASMATAPFALYHFDRIAGLGLVANVLAMPIITFLSAPAAAISLLLTPFGLDGLGLRLFGYSLEAVLNVAHWSSSFDETLLKPGTPMPVVSLVSLLASLGAFIVLQGLWRWTICGIAAAAAIASWQLSSQDKLYWTPDGAVYTVSAEDGIKAYQVMESGGLPPMRFADLPTEAACATLPCDITVGSYIFKVVSEEDVVCPPASETTRLLIISGRASKCPQAHSWADVQEAGSLIVSLSLDGSISAQNVSCSPRPWARCGR